MPATVELVYRTRTFAVIGWSLLGLVGLILVTVALAHPPPAWFWLPVTGLVAGAAAWLIHRCYLAPRVVATDTGLRVVNPFATKHLRWWDVERFESRPGLTVVGRDGSTISVWAVPHPSAGRLVGRASQGEPVAVALTRQLAAAKLPPDRPVAQPN
jgi:hypothetical protein